MFGKRVFSFRRVLSGALFSLLFLCSHAFADLGASVTLNTGQPTDIYPGETTELRITLSNSNSAAQITSAGFSNSLPGTLPDGLKVDGVASYSCTDPSGALFIETGSLTAVDGTQSIVLSGATIPANSGGTDGTCTLIIPVTAGTSDGSADTYTYTITDQAVSGTDDTGTVRNTGDVSQSINVRALARPTIDKNFSSSILVLNGSATTLTITLTNSNPVDITGVSINDTFPTLSGNPIIEVATTPGAGTICPGGLVSATAGAGSVSMSGATIPAGGSCTLTVDVEAAHTDGRYITNTQTNRIDSSSDFSSDIGLSAAGDATDNVRTRSPLRVSKSFSPSSLASGQPGAMTITLSNDSDSDLTIATPFDDSPIDGIGNALEADGGLWVTGASTTCGGGVATITADNRGVRLSAGATIPAGGSCTVSADFTATTQDPNTPVTYTNTIPEGAVDVGAAEIVSQSRSATILVADTLRVLKSNGSSNPRPGSPALYSITVQNWSSSDMSNVQVLDTLSNGMSYLTGVINGLDYTPSLSGTGCVGLSTTNTTGDTNLSFTIGTLPQRSGDSSPGACTISFYAMTDPAAADGSSTVNTISVGAVCNNNGAGPICNGGSASSGNSPVDTTVLSATKSFSPAGPLNEGTVSTMTVTLSNYSVNEITSLSISDTLPISGSSQMQVASPANAATTCGGTITAVAGTTSVSLNGGTVPARANQGSGAAGSCFLQVDVVGAAGNYTNIAAAAGNETYADGTLNPANPITANANASITYTSALSATKSFSPGSVSSGGQSTVTVRLDNSGGVALTNVAVTDPLPTGMVLASPTNAYSTCAGSPSISGNAGDSSITLSGADIAGSGSCDLLFDVVATGSSDWTNTIPVGNITADGGVRNTTAVSATLGYDAPTSLTVAKATSPSTLTFPGQDSQLTITITNGTQAVTNLALTDYFTSDGTSGATANGMVVAATPSASTTCPGGLVNATAGDTS